MGLGHLMSLSMFVGLAYGVTQLLGSYGVHLGCFLRFAIANHRHRSNHQLKGCSAGTGADFELLGHLHSLK
jgi:hypothetical protein